MYFSIDDENYDEERCPGKGVKGKGTVTQLEDLEKVVPIGEKLNLKYLRTLEHPLAKMLMDNAKSGNFFLIDINPKFFSTWDYAKNARLA